MPKIGDVNSEKGVHAEDTDTATFLGECEWFSVNKELGDDFLKIRKDEQRNRTGAASSALEPKRTSFSTAFLNIVMRQPWRGYFLSAGLLLTGMVLSSLFHSQCAMKDRLVQRKAPSPVRFFPRNSPVTEFHDGNGFDVYKLLSAQTDRHGSIGILFVMFYAPWCARSMDAKWHMDNLARHFYPTSDDSGGVFHNTSSSSEPSSMHGPVHFIAVNCWEPSGHCHRSFKIYSYPLFLVYPGSSDAIYYNGIVSADYMFRFLENLITPFDRLQDDKDVIDFLNDPRTSAIAYFQFDEIARSADYLQFYYAALSGLERDPLRAAVKFAIITQRDLASRLDFSHHGQIRLYRQTNENFLEYPRSDRVEAKAISKWSFENLANPVRWISPSGGSAGKSTALHEFWSKKPTLILFAPRQPLFDSSISYAKLTDVALTYFNCSETHAEGSSLSTNHVSRTQTLKRLYGRLSKSSLERQRLSDFCLRRMRDQARLLNDCCGDISRVVKAGQTTLYDYRQRNICHVCHTETFRKPFLSRVDLSAYCERWYTKDDFSSAMSPATRDFLIPIFSSRSCDSLINDYLPKASVIDYCCAANQKVGVSGPLKRRLPRRQRRYLDESNAWTIPNCEKLHLSRLLRYSYDDQIDEATLSDRSFTPWLGLACQTNRTIQFAAVDSNYFGAFARNLGLSIERGAPLAVLFDSEKEAVYVMDDPLDVDHLGALLVNFTYGRLVQFYRSEKRNGSLSDVDCLSSVCVHAVTTSTFHSVVMDEGKDVVLFYMAAWCGACQRLFHVYQTLAYYFRVVKSDILFAQVDLTSNDLPWHFTSDNLPSLIFFPAHRKSESIVFPAYAPWTLPNLVAFVLAHSQYTTRLRFALSTCIRNSTGAGFVTESRCLVRNRYLAWMQLSRNLRRIRKFKREVGESIQRRKMEWDGGLSEGEWRVYLQRSWQEISRMAIKVRALRTLLVDALQRLQFDRLAF